MEDRIQDGSLYTGRPSAQLDKAWHDLLNGQSTEPIDTRRNYLTQIDENILLEPEYIDHYGRLDTTVEVPEGGRYIGTLNVFHELHCLKRIHQFMYSDYYFPDISEHQKEVNRLHNGMSQYSRAAKSESPISASVRIFNLSTKSSLTRCTQNTASTSYANLPCAMVTLASSHTAGIRIS